MSSATKKLLYAILNMLTVTLACLSISTSHAQLPNQDISTWQRVHTKDEEFSILMPIRLPVYVKQNQNLGRVNRINVSTQRVVSGYQNGVVFVVEIYDTSNPNGLLHDYFDIFHSAKGDKQNINFNGFEGIQYLRKEAGLYHKIQCFATKRRVYVIHVAGRYEISPDISRFLSSFKLGNMKAGPDIDDSTNGEDSSNTNSIFPASSSGTNRVFDKGDVSHPAITLFLPIPVRPNGFRGVVKIKMVLSSSAEVTDILLPKGLSSSVSQYFADLAKYMIFLPAEKDGHPVSQHSEMIFNFQ